MPGFVSIRDLADADAAGRTHLCSFRKVPSQASTAGWWADLSMASGNPPPNYYVGTELEATALEGHKGIFHGYDKAPSSLHLTHLGVMSPTAGFVGQMTLCDYLLFYPFVDGDSTDEQPMDNTVTLPRYADGDGVMVMAVAVAPTTGGGVFTFNYVDSDGNAQTSPTQTCTTSAANITNIVTSMPATAGSGAFCKLAAGSKGVRSITSLTFSVANGGLLALVLVKPLADLAIREVNTMSEMEFVSRRPGAPRIYDGAYLNLICNTAATIAAGTLTGYARFAWSE